MILRRLAALALLLFVSVSSAQSFTAADLRPAPTRSYPFFYAVLLHQDRYVVRDATLVDLISIAYGLDRDSVQAGPPWIDYNRFDLIAKVPRGTSPAALKLMLRALLSERFHLALHDGERPMPAYILTADKPRLKPADSSSPSACDNKSGPRTGPTYLIDLVCTNFTLDAFAERIHQMAGGYLTSPVVNSTHLDGAFDFDLKWSNRGDLEKAGPDGISLFDAVEKQLGLKFTFETAPRSVVLVDTASQTPSPNLPGIEKILPPTSGSQFEVATIKPSQSSERGQGRIAGGVVNFTNIPLKNMIDLAWDLNESDPEAIVNAPKWLNEDHYDILAKVAPDSSGVSASSGSGDLPMDVYEVQLMLQALLIERFQIKAHMEDRPISSYELVAASPRLKPADPSTRTVCKEGPGPDGKDPRIANPVLNRLFTCSNVTMPEFAAELQHLAGGYIFNPVLDSTNLKGGYDITLSFTSAFHTPSGASLSEPDGAVSIFEAVKSQLGLKLEKQKRNLPILVLDHIEQKPTEN